MPTSIIKTKIGFLKIKTKNGKVLSLEFADDKSDPIYADEDVVADIKNYFRARSEDFGSELKIVGTPFQRKVWKRIQKIPYGETKTYGEIAKEIGQPTAYRAVANACGQNKLALFIPCHRVVGKNNLGGFRWGTDKKSWLLDFESESE